MNTNRDLLGERKKLEAKAWLASAILVRNSEKPIQPERMELYREIDDGSTCLQYNLYIFTINYGVSFIAKIREDDFNRKEFHKFKHVGITDIPRKALEKLIEIANEFLQKKRKE